MIGIEIICANCSVQFFCCRRCWRGNKYCSSVCRVEARKIKHREYEKKYAATFAGQESRRKRQRTFRAKNKNDLNVTDHSMKDDLVHANYTKKLNIEARSACFTCNCHIRNLIFRGDSYGIQFKSAQKENSYFSFTRI